MNGSWEYCSVVYESPGPSHAASWWYVVLPGRRKEKVQVHEEPDHFANNDYTAILNLLGEDGWELVTSSEDTIRANLYKFTFVLKRPVGGGWTNHPLRTRSVSSILRERPFSEPPPDPTVAAKEKPAAKGKK